MASEFNFKTLPFWYPAIIFAACGALFAAAVYNVNNLPSGLTSDDGLIYVDRFIAARAQQDTFDLANLGPKVPGSTPNRLAKEMLLQKIDLIKSNTNPVHQLEIDVQTASGSFPFLNWVTVYSEVNNVVVRLSPSGQTPAHSLLLNSHFDSVFVSDGASDDTFMVANMLEVLRVMATSPLPQTHAIVFLFNGAEENGMIGAQAFVQSHPWAQNIGAFMNLDSAGAGGKERLFQITPGSGWLLRAYAAAVPRPLGNAAIQEMFEAGLVPSITDYQVFRYVGKMIGVDIANVANGYVYHTRYDRPEIIPIGSYQNVGDNVLALTRLLANADELGADMAEEDLVYFDFAGWFMIFYTTGSAVAINVCVSVAVLVLIGLTLRSYAWKSETSYLVILAELALVLVAQLLAIILAAALVILAAFLYDVFGRPLSWYTHVWLIAGLYGAPLIVGLLAGPTIYLMIYGWRFARASRMQQNIGAIQVLIRRSYHIQLFLHAHAVLIVLLLLGLTAANFRSSYVLVIGLVFYGITTLANYVFRLHLHDTRWMYVHLIGQILPFVFYENMLVEILDAMVAIQGRTGTAMNPEYTIGTFVFLLGLLGCGFLVPVIGFVRRPIWWLGGVALVWLIAIGVMFTPVGFPYRPQTSEQRLSVFHTLRSFNTLSGTGPQSDQGLLMLGSDRHAFRFVKDIVPGINQATGTTSLCGSYLNCGMPMLTDGGLWLPVNYSTPTEAARTTLALISNEPTANETIRRYTFDVSGPNSINLFMSPSADNRLVKLTFGDEDEQRSTRTMRLEREQERLIFMVYLLNGNDKLARQTVRFAFDLESRIVDSGTLNFDIAVVGQHVDQRELQTTTEFSAFLANFPNWVHVTAGFTSYESWQY